RIGGTMFNMSKCALDMFVKCVSLELANKEIKINSINQGTVRDQGDIISKQLLSRIPLGRVGYPIDMANCILYLASDDSIFINGSSLLCDGGQLYN
ncbi:unnamed protein product, partial [Oppiella nova]